ncbi:hypothetical protein BCR34DRAFT_582071 [Clohesyomyces aquaticus]|uniref:Uncharacterized protein n=1 Tax=Clohesyomyces aquaticus TaxID=1231657 RepID=A0A1Y2ACZ4_9PLEO|nr:hypothetical protein BCR34DRAFT_582071 [Clohesyomyces aquaticus]
MQHQRGRGSRGRQDCLDTSEKQRKSRDLGLNDNEQLVQQTAETKQAAKKRHRKQSSGATRRPMALGRANWDGDQVVTEPLPTCLKPRHSDLGTSSARRNSSGTATPSMQPSLARAPIPASQHPHPRSPARIRRINMGAEHTSCPRLPRPAESPAALHARERGRELGSGREFPLEHDRTSRFDACMRCAWIECRGCQPCPAASDETCPLAKEQVSTNHVNVTGSIHSATLMGHFHWLSCAVG